MKKGLAAIAGFFCTVVSLSLPEGWSFYGLAIVYSLLLFSLFYLSESAALFFGYSATISLELFGASHFGLASLLLVTVLVFQYLFGQLLRFTSRFSRFIVSLLLTLFSYCLVLFSTTFFLERFWHLLVLIPFLTAFYYLLTLRERSHNYELL